MSSHPFTIRLARSDELRALASIDDDASALYAEAGLHVVFDADHPFVVAELQRWERAIARGLSHVAADAEERPLAFMTLGIVDGAPYLDQLSVRKSAMRRGIGSALLEQAFVWSGSRALWLTTYAHLAWNRPYYERYGFTQVPEGDCGPELRAILEEQRGALPHPDQRIAMVRR